ncbi:MAG: ketopantoate reductase family protein [Deltaproteobacteria bacterium]|nr:ketopantoate reductase family protein [Deltaproteobacteria bacterium]
MEACTVTILGAGAMGGLLAAKLSAVGSRVRMLTRNPDKASGISRDGLVLEENDGQITYARVECATSAEGWAPPDLLIVCVKSYDTAPAMQAHAAHVGDETAVLTLQNGLGNVEALADVIPATQILVGVTTHGALTVAPGRVRHTGLGTILLGETDGRRSERASWIARLLDDADLQAGVAEDPSRLLWEKLVINAAINPVTAMLRVRNGEIATNPDARTLALAAASEAVDVARALGVALDKGAMLARVIQVAEATAANRSSMLADVEAGRRTEIDAINGAVVREAARLGIEVSANVDLLRRIREMEQN